MNNIISIKDAEGESISLTILEATKFRGISYILTADEAGYGEGACYILKDMSENKDGDAVYEFVENDEELEAVFDIFVELMSDTDIELTR